MAKYGSPSVLIGVTTASGSTALKDLTQFIDTINGFKINAATQESHTFGDSWVEHLYTGLRSMDDLTLGGFYDDNASGPHAFMGQTSDVGSERQIELDFGSSDIVHFNYILVSYARQPVRGELTKFEAVLKPTGAPTTST